MSALGTFISNGNNKELDIWQKATRILFILFLVVLAGIAITYMKPQERKQKKLLDTYLYWKDVGEQLELRRNLLERKMFLLETNPSYQEIFIRDSLNYSKPGEIIIRFVPTNGNEIVVETELVKEEELIDVSINRSKETLDVSYEKSENVSSEKTISEKDENIYIELNRVGSTEEKVDMEPEFIPDG